MTENTRDRTANINLIRVFSPYIGRLSSHVQIFPAWLPANAITISRAILLYPIYIAYHNSAILWVIALFLMALLTDMVDGQHARFRRQVSNLGKLLDPAADKILILGLLILVAPGRFPQFIFYLIFSLEIVLAVMVLIKWPLFNLVFGVKRIPGANAFGKIKLTLESISMLILLVGLDVKTCQQVAEFIMYGAAFFAFLSIVFHIISIDAIRQRSNAITNQILINKLVH